MSLKPFVCLVMSSYLLDITSNQIEAIKGYGNVYQAYEMEYLWLPFGRAHNLIRGGTHTKSETSNVDPTPVVVTEPNKYENKYMDNADDLQKQLDLERKERNRHMKIYRPGLDTTAALGTAASRPMQAEELENKDLD